MEFLLCEYFGFSNDFLTCNSMQKGSFILASLTCCFKIKPSKSRGMGITNGHLTLSYSSFLFFFSFFFSFLLLFSFLYAILFDGKTTSRDIFILKLHKRVKIWCISSDHCQHSSFAKGCECNRRITYFFFFDVLFAKKVEWFEKKLQRTKRFPSQYAFLLRPFSFLNQVGYNVHIFLDSNYPDTELFSVMIVEGLWDCRRHGSTDGFDHLWGDLCWFLLTLLAWPLIRLAHKWLISYWSVKSWHSYNK